MNKKRISRIIEFLLIILCIVSLGFLMLQSYQKNQETESAVTEFSSDWFYYRDGEKVEVNLPVTITDYKEDTLNLYHVRITDDEDLKTIITKGAYYRMQIKLGARVLYEYNDEAFPRNAQMRHKLECRTQLPDHVGGKKITCVYKNDGSNTFKIKPIYIGYSDAVLRYQLTSEGLVLLLVFIMFLISMASLVVHIYLKYKKVVETRFLHAAIYLVSCGIWCLTDTSLFQNLFDYSPAVAYVSFYMFMFFPVPMIHFIRDTRGMEKYRILNWLNYIFYVNILVQSVLKLLQVFELIDMLIITHVLIVIAIIILEICLYKEYQAKRTKEIRTILFAFVVVSVIGITSLLLYWLFDITRYGFIFELGNLIFAIILMSGLLYTAFHNMQFRVEATIYNKLARRDNLTQLPDIQYFQEWLSEQNVSKIYMTAVVLFQLKRVNTIYGTSFGNEMLRKVSEYIKERVDVNQMFRVGGNQFVLTAYSKSEAKRMQKELKELFDEELQIGEEQIHVPAIICGVEYEHGQESEVVLSYIEYLTAQAVKSGDTIVIQGNQETMDGFQYEKEIESFLPKAIREDLFEVYYQPIYSLERQRFVALEALSRLRHPKFGMIPPDVFIRIAENTGQINALSSLQFRRICRFMKAHPELREKLLSVKFNLSPAQFLKKGYCHSLIAMIHEYDLPVSFFQFEITETVATEYNEELYRFVKELQAERIGLCLDDFGSGYANLNTVLKLPFACVKMDCSLLQGIMEDEKVARFYRNMCAILKNQGYNLIAEGVEEKKEVELLNQWGIDLIQGYYFSRPLCEEELLRQIVD